MDQGFFAGSSLCGYSKMAMGWLKPVVITEPGVYTVNCLTETAENSLYRIDIPGAKEFFLVENRRRYGTDSWDRGISDEGLVITHVDGELERYVRYGSYNFNIVKDNHCAICVEDAGADRKTKADAAFSAEDGQTRFGPDTTPSSLPYSPDKTHKADKAIAITEVSKSGSQMTFRVDSVPLEGLSVKMESIVPSFAEPGEVGVPLVKISVGECKKKGSWEFMRVDLDRETADHDVAALRLFRDANHDGLFQRRKDKDVTKSVGALCGGVATLTLHPQEVGGSAAVYFLVCDVSSHVSPGAEFAVRIASPTCFRLKDRGQTVFFGGSEGSFVTPVITVSEKRTSVR
jgi:hypothetical protein